MIKNICMIISLILIILLIPSITFLNKDQNISKDSNKKLSPNTTIKILDHETNKVFKIKIEEYIKGVVFSEISANFDKEAIKAQAIIANTNLLSYISKEQMDRSTDLKGAHIGTNPNIYQGYISDKKAKERYKDKFNEYNNKIKDCVNEVISYAIVYEDKPIIAAYHSISNGSTEDSVNIWGKEIPYLKSVKSESDINESEYYSSTILNEDQVKEIVSKYNSNIIMQDNPTEWIKVAEHSNSNTVYKATIGNIEVSGNQLREIFKLNSSTFEIQHIDSNFVFKTKGIGHGVGMSQSGANYMAINGSTYDQILLYYYQNTQIKKIY